MSNQIKDLQKQAIQEKEVKKHNVLTFNVYDFSTSKQEVIDLNSSRDIRKLDYILRYQSHQLKKADYENCLHLFNKLKGKKSQKKTSLFSHH